MCIGIGIHRGKKSAGYNITSTVGCIEIGMVLWKVLEKARLENVLDEQVSRGIGEREDFFDTGRYSVVCTT